MEFDVHNAGSVASTIASLHPFAVLAITCTTFALKPMFVPETIVIVLPTIVEIPSRVVLFDEITIERSGELAVFAPVTTEDNAVYAFAALIVPSAVPLAYANDSLAWNRLFAIVIVASRASAIYFVKFQRLNAVAPRAPFVPAGAVGELRIK